jgi:hypothetical protein
MNFKIFIAPVAALLLSTLAASAEVDLGDRSKSTPYDTYMQPVTTVLGGLEGERASMERVVELMRIGRAFRYSHTTPYEPNTPEVTGSRRVGDCKDKSLWLCDQLGDENIRFVVGLMKGNIKCGHAWAMWHDGTEWWVLDCTLNSRPIPASKVRKGDYVPLYSWTKTGTYRHAGTSLLAAASQRSTAVASR